MDKMGPTARSLLNIRPYGPQKNPMWIYTSMNNHENPWSPGRTDPSILAAQAGIIVLRAQWRS